MAAAFARMRPPRSCAPQERSKTYSASVPAGLRLLRRWIGDHRREIGLGGELAVDQRPAGKLADAGALLDEFHLEAEQATGLDRLTKFRPLDGHEINQLAAVREAEGFDRENARR